MTNREAFFQLDNLKDKHLTRNVIKVLLIKIGHFNDFFDLLKHFDETIKDPILFSSYVERIKKGEPYQYVMGESFFVNGNYKVTPDVLIPRQETEQLAVGTYYYTMKKYGETASINICDIGTGSGVLGIYLKEKFGNSKVFATDISKKALGIAKENAKLHNVEIEYLEGNMVDPLLNLNLKFDVLVSNPPYIESKNTIDDDVWNYEPHLALLANPSHKFYEEIFQNVNKIMNKKFILAFEIGEDMEELLTSLVEKYLPDVLYKFEKDLYNKTRFLYIIKDEE